MKKLLTLVAAAFMAVSVFAQSGTPLELKGGWNAGFAGDAEVYNVTISGLWAAAKFACNVKSEDYYRYILEFEGPLPANFQVNYTWKTSADAAGEATAEYCRAQGNGKQEIFDLLFDQKHPYIVDVDVQHTDKEKKNLKVKQLILCHRNGSTKKINATFTGDVTDNTVTYKGVVSFDKQYQQLAINGVAGKKDLAIKVQLEKPTPNVQMCVDYADGTSEWPSFAGSDKITFTTKKGVAIKNVGIQYIDEENNPAKVSVLGAWLVDTPTGISKVENLEVAKDGKSFNLAGQQVGKNYKGVVIKNGKKMVIK